MPSPLQKNAMNLADFMRSDGLGSTDHSIQDELKFIQKYDPSASIQRMNANDPSGGFDKVQYDGTKLPQVKEGYTPDYTIGQPTTKGWTPRIGHTTEHAIKDDNYGWLIPNSDLGSIDEKANTAQQSADTGFIGKLTAGFDQKPWAVLPAAVGMGLGGAGLSAMQQAGANLGLGAITSGGKNLTDPMSYLGAAMGAVAPSLPPDLLKTLGYVKTAYGWVKNPIGSAANLAVNKLIGS